MQLGLKQYGVIVCINTSQFYSEEQGRFITMYIIKKGRKEIIKTASQIKVVEALKAELDMARAEQENAEDKV